MIRFILFITFVGFGAATTSRNIFFRGENEEFSKCVNRRCEKTCEDPIGPFECSGKCFPGYTCKEHYFRNTKGQCVLGTDCDNCRGDQNAFVDPCGDPCPITCENQYHARKPCQEKCIRNGCKCRDKFIQDPDGKCILPSRCPPLLKCKLNEVYDPCPECLDESCRQLKLGHQLACPFANTCIPRCRCKNRYVRDDYGWCVSRKYCCPNSHENFVPCPNPCYGGTCAHPKFVPCKKACQPYGCECKKGYLRVSDTDSRCIPIKSCPK